MPKEDFTEMHPPPFGVLTWGIRYDPNQNVADYLAYRIRMGFVNQIQLTPEQSLFTVEEYERATGYRFS